MADLIGGAAKPVLVTGISQNEIRVTNGPASPVYWMGVTQEVLDTLSNLLGIDNIVTISNFFITVDADGSGDYTTLAEAVSNASSGDKIIILSNLTETEDIATGKNLYIVAFDYTITALGCTITATASLTLDGGIWVYDSIHITGGAVFTGMTNVIGVFTSATVVVSGTGTLTLGGESTVQGLSISGPLIDIQDTTSQLNIRGSGVLISVSGAAQNVISCVGSMIVNGGVIAGSSNISPIQFKAGADLSSSNISHLHVLSAGGATPGSIASVDVWNPAEIALCRLENGLSGTITTIAGANNVLV